MRREEPLGDDTSYDEAAEAIRSLIDAVVLTPSDGSMTIELRGDLAAILSLGAAHKAKPGLLSETGLLEQIKMVAGA